MAEPRGAIVGTFLVGELKAGEVQYPFDPPGLVLLPHKPSIRSEAFTSLAFERPSLELLGKEAALDLRTSITVEVPTLELTARQVGAQVPPAPVLQKPLLTLETRSFVFTNEVTLGVGRPFLELLARRTAGYKPGLTPTVPLDWILVPTTPLEETLVPVGAAEDGYLTPTTEVPA